MSDDQQNTRIAPFGLRMPPDLKERVAQAAKAANRSVNAEIVATLEEKYPAPKWTLEEAQAAARQALDMLFQADQEGRLVRGSDGKLVQPQDPEVVKLMMRMVEAMAAVPPPDE